MPQAIEVPNGVAIAEFGTAPCVAFPDMEHLVHKGAACGECHNLLKIVWGGAWGCNYYILTCGDMAHNTILKIEQKTKQQINSEKVFKGYSMKALTEYTPTEMVARADSAGLFSQNMNQAQRAAIAQVCIEYSLDPLMREVQIYQGAPYITMAARLRKAQEAPMPLSGISTRPASEAEKTARGYLAEDNVMVAEGYKQNGNQRLGPFVGWGIVKQAEIDRNVANAKRHDRRADALPIVNDPAQHAEKRAISRCLRMGWHIPLPTFEDIGEDGNGADDPPKVYDIPPQAEAGNDANGPEVEKAKAKRAGKAEGPPAAATGATAGEPKGNGLVIPPTNYGELKAIVHARQPEIKPSDIDAWIYKTCGMDGAGVSADPSAAYTELKTLCGWED